MKALIPFASLLMMSASVLPAAAEPVILEGEWQSYLSGFVQDSGRVVDAYNGNISHSESQGYGLWLAVLAEDRAGFERIWTFTESELLVRPDGLAAWRWEPDADPHVTDTNNATDGDMLIAYALHLAGALWDEPAYSERAKAMIETIGRTMVVEADGMEAILPGELGFAADEENSEPIINLSYWIFEMLPVFAGIDPSVDWKGVYDSGLDINRRAAATPAGVAPDWARLTADGIEPAEGFAPEFGYNNIRVPLYLMRAEIGADYLETYRQASDAQGLYRIDVVSGERIELISEPGYRLIQAAMECIATGVPVAEELRSFAATSYYAATLQLLLLDHLRRNRPDCVGGWG